MRKFYFVMMNCFLMGQVQASSSVSSSISAKILEEGALKAQKVSSEIMDMAGKKSRCAGWIQGQFLQDSFSKMKGFRHCVNIVLANDAVNAAVDSGAVTEDCNWSSDHHISKTSHKKHRFGKGNYAVMSSVKALCGVLFPRLKNGL